MNSAMSAFIGGTIGLSTVMLLPKFGLMPNDKWFLPISMGIVVAEALLVEVILKYLGFSMDFL